MGHFLLFKISPHMRRLHSHLVNPREKFLHLCFRKRLSPNNRRDEKQNEQKRGNDAHVDLIYSSRQTLGLAAAIAGNAKKIVATRLQKIPIAQVTPSPLSEGLRAQASEPNPLTAVSPARMTGLITPATSCSSSRVFCQTSTT